MNITAWIIVILTFLLAGWDIFADIKWGYQGTISYDILTAAYDYPVIPLAAGILLGHLFWPQPQK